MKGILAKGKEFRKDLFKKEDKEGAAAEVVRPKLFGGVIDRDGNEIPRVVSKCVEFLDATGLEFEGIFRKSGSLMQMNEYKARFERGEDVDLSVILDPHIVAGLLKMYVRELAEPLLTFELYDVFLATVAIKEVSARLPKLRQVLTFLPRTNLMVVRYLVSFLTRVSAKSSINMMTPSNLAIVFAPNLLRPPLSGEQEIAAIMEDTPYSNELLQVFITHFQELFDGVASEKASEPKLLNSDTKSSGSFIGSPNSFDKNGDHPRKSKPLPPIPPGGYDAATYETHAQDQLKPLPKPAAQPTTTVPPLTRKASHEYAKPLPAPASRPLASSGPVPLVAPSAQNTPSNTQNFNNNPFIVSNGAPRSASPKPPQTNPFIDSSSPQPSPVLSHPATTATPSPPPKKAEKNSNRHARAFAGGNAYTQLQ